MQFVQYSDADKTAIVAVFAGPQDVDVYPNQGEVEDDDPLYVAFITPPVVEVVTDPVEKLKAFLSANPDVSALLGQ